jgi:hypothetical protein
MKKIPEANCLNEYLAPIVFEEFFPTDRAELIGG